MDLSIENYLESLGLSWITIAEAMSDENQEKTRKIINQNPKITKKEFLNQMGIEED